jgi:uncharacterized protein (DUF305 family)
MSGSRRVFLAGAAAAVAPVTAPAQHHHAEVPTAGFGVEMHDAMTAMAAAMKAAPMHGDPDRDFLAMMIPHHQGAIDMARLVLIHGRDPLVRQLAEEIIAAQQAEILSMAARLRILETRKPDADAFPALSGTRGN